MRFPFMLRIYLCLCAIAFSLITSWKLAREGRQGGGGSFWRSLDQLVSCQFDVPDACVDLSNMLRFFRSWLDHSIAARSLNKKLLFVIFFLSLPLSLFLLI